MIIFFLFFFQRKMKKKIIIRTSLFLYTCVVIGVVTVLVQKIRTNKSKQKSPTEEETTTEDQTTTHEEPTHEEPTDEDSTTPSTLSEKSGNTVKVLSIIVFVLEVLMLFFLLYLCTLFSHNHIFLVDNNFFQKSREEKTHNEITAFNANKKLIPKIKIIVIVSILFVFANILIIVIPVLLYHNMDKLKFILNGIGIFLYLVTMVSLLTGENRKTSGEIVQTGIGLLMQEYK